MKSRIILLLVWAMILATAGPAMAAPSVRLQVPADAPTFVDLILTVSYQSNGQDKTDTFKSKVPIVQYEGQDLEQLGDAQELAASTTEAGTSPWVEVSYAGFAPVLENFSVSVTDTAGLEIAYPLNGSSTSLSHNSTLEGGETDFVPFKLIDRLPAHMSWRSKRPTQRAANRFRCPEV